MTDALVVGHGQQKTTFQRQTGTNLITRITDPLGRKTDYAYDACGDAISVTRLAGTPEAVTTTLSYQTGADCISTYNLVTSVTDPLNHTTSFSYDARGSLTSVQWPIPSIPATTMGYSPAGQVADSDQENRSFRADVDQAAAERRC